jgi:membrane protein DedA with SNARE-associated domain
MKIFFILLLKVVCILSLIIGSTIGLTFFGIFSFKNNLGVCFVIFCGLLIIGLIAWAWYYHDYK